MWGLRRYVCGLYVYICVSAQCESLCRCECTCECVCVCVCVCVSVCCPLPLSPLSLQVKRLFWRLWSCVSLLKQGWQHSAKIETYSKPLVLAANTMGHQTAATSGLAPAVSNAPSVHIISISTSTSNLQYSNDSSNTVLNKSDTMCQSSEKMHRSLTQKPCFLKMYRLHIFFFLSTDLNPTMCCYVF